MFFPRTGGHLSDQDWSSSLILLNSLLQDPGRLATPSSPGASLAPPGPAHGGGGRSPGPPQLARLSDPKTPRELLALFGLQGSLPGAAARMAPLFYGESQAQRSLAAAPLMQRSQMESDLNSGLSDCGALALTSRTPCCVTLADVFTSLSCFFTSKLGPSEDNRESMCGGHHLGP